MKTRMRKLLSVLLLLGVLLCAQKAALAETPQKNAVCELYSDDGFYEDSIGNGYAYSYHLPQINADTADAREINAEIAELFGSRVEAQYQSMEGGHSLWLFRTEWQAYRDGSRLYLLITADQDGDNILYGAYGYDLETGERVTNEMLLEQKGISGEAYRERLREKVIEMFEEQYRLIPEGVKTELDHDRLLKETLSFLEEERPIFVNQYGELETIVEIAVVAGAGKYSRLVTPFS